MNNNLQGNCAAHFNKGNIRPLTLYQRIKLFFFGSRWARSTKYCPRCGNTKLGEMPSLRLKTCPDCHYWFAWKLAKNQKPTL